MRKYVAAPMSLRPILAVVGLALALMAGGCGPVNGKILEEFILDVARGALAAWLL